MFRTHAEQVGWYLSLVTPLSYFDIMGEDNVVVPFKVTGVVAEEDVPEELSIVLNRALG